MNSILNLVTVAILAGHITSCSLPTQTTVEPVALQVDELSTKAPGLNKKVLTLALNAYNHANLKGQVKKADFNCHRLFIAFF